MSKHVRLNHPFFESLRDERTGTAWPAVARPSASVCEEMTHDIDRSLGHTTAEFRLSATVGITYTASNPLEQGHAKEEAGLALVMCLFGDILKPLAQAQAAIASDQPHEASEFLNEIRRFIVEGSK